MANKYTGSEVAGPGKGKNRPNSKAKVAARETASKASGMSAQKFYVKTRMAEAAKSGKTLNAKDLRQKFQSGDVARKGFGAPKKKTDGGGKKPPTKTGGLPDKYIPGMGGNPKTKYMPGMGGNPNNVAVTKSKKPSNKK